MSVKDKIINTTNTTIDNFEYIAENNLDICNDQKFTSRSNYDFQKISLNES